MNLRKCVLTMTVAVCAGIAVNSASAQDVVDPAQQLEFNLFQNFYTQPGVSMTQAAMYNAPRPVPYWVGHSYYTYQPFYPHQHLYPHVKNYYQYYGTSDQFYSDNCPHGKGGDALNKTTVVWQSCNNHMGNLPLSGLGIQRLRYGIYSRNYCLNCDPNR